MANFGKQNYANMPASAQYTGLRRLPDEFQQSKMKANPELITKDDMMTRGRGWVSIPPKSDDVINEQPKTVDPFEYI